jgi:esterase/lipase
MKKQKEQTTEEDLPEDLDQYLRQKESRIPGITAGAEKTIVWAGRPGQKTALSIIYLHGFTATRQEIAPVFDRVARSMGANLFYTRLAGHGVPGDELGKVTVKDWMDDAWEAYRIGSRIGDRVIVAAMSTGVPLALWLAAQKTPEIVSLTLASANMKLADPLTELLLWPWPVPSLILRLAVGRYRTVPSQNELDARFWTKTYPSTCLVTLMETLRLARRLAIETITIPSLWIYAARDDLVDLSEIKKCYARIGSTTKKLVEIADATGHALAGDILSPGTTDLVVQEVLAFLAH